jgi:hypothetical protein
MLEARGKSVFRHAVESFAAYFDSEPFLFVIRAGAGAFVQGECRAMGVRTAECVELGHPTRGQAETVAMGLRAARVQPGEAATIFNIDTFRPGFRFPEWSNPQPDGFLEVFVGSGPQWSYVRPASPDSETVAETAEKREISNLCSDGLYHFAAASDFLEAFDEQAARPLTEQDGVELYVAPLYNALIRRGRDIRYRMIRSDEVVFCGVPAEFEAFRAAGSRATP